MANVSNNDIARAIYLSYKDSKPGEQSLFAKNVISFLNRKRLLSKSSNILSALSKIVDKEEGNVVVKVSSKKTLDAETKKELIHFISKRYTARNVSLVENIDEKVLGGFKIEVNNEVLDLTLKNKIEKLKDYLKTEKDK